MLTQSGNSHRAGLLFGDERATSARDPRSYGVPARPSEESHRGGTRSQYVLLAHRKASRSTAQLSLPPAAQALFLASRLRSDSNRCGGSERSLGRRWKLVGKRRTRTASITAARWVGTFVLYPPLVTSNVYNRDADRSFPERSKKSHLISSASKASSPTFSTSPRSTPRSPLPTI